MLHRKLYLDVSKNSLPLFKMDAFWNSVIDDFIAGLEEDGYEAKLIDDMEDRLKDSFKYLNVSMKNQEKITENKKIPAGYRNISYNYIEKRCVHIFTRGPNEGKYCNANPKHYVGDRLLCSNHDKKKVVIAEPSSAKKAEIKRPSEKSFK